jgi:hypothetical protein
LAFSFPRYRYTKFDPWVAWHIRLSTLCDCAPGFETRGLHPELEFDQVPNIAHAFDMGFPDSKLLVVVHGGYHLGWNQRKQDETHIELARHEGWKVITVWNNEIDTNLDRVMSTILAALGGGRR